MVFLRIFIDFLRVLGPLGSVFRAAPAARALALRRCRSASAMCDFGFRMGAQAGVKIGSNGLTNVGTNGCKNERKLDCVVQGK